MRRLLCALTVVGMLGLIVTLPGGGDDPPDPKWGPFSGRIVDADTGRSIPGAVALVVWLWTAPGHSTQRFYDARVAVTRSDGMFELPRRAPAFFGILIDEPLTEYSAPGYALIRLVAAADGLQVAHLRKWELLTPQELSHHRVRTGYAGWIPGESQAALIDAINGERRRLGLGSIDVLSEGLRLAAEGERRRPRP